MTSLRRMMVELRPPILDEGGLTAAMRDLADHVLASTPVACDVRSTIDGARLAPELETVVYRVAREALVNVKKHSDAAHVELVLERRDDWFRVAVADDGKGFDMSCPKPHRDGPHVGLLTMQERVEGVGGSWAFSSSPGTGTRLEATFPWKPQTPERNRDADYSIAA